MPRQAAFQTTLGRTVNSEEPIGGWNNGPLHYANQKFALDWIQIPRKRTIDSGRFIITRVNRKKRNRK